MTAPTQLPAQPVDPLVVEVWSDVVCPWCYIGKRRLEAALQDFAHADEVEIRWRSFELDPTTPRSGEPGGGEDLATFLGRRYGGGRENGLAMNANVSGIAKGDGLAYRLEDAVRSNTVDAHRLLHLADALGGPPLQGALKERLLAAYFTEGAAIDDHPTLQRLATEAGLDGARTAQVLSSDEFTQDVRDDVAQAQAFGAGGVPFVVIDRTYGISGAQPAAVFARALDQAWSDRASR